MILSKQVTKDGARAFVPTPPSELGLKRQAGLVRLHRRMRQSDPACLLRYRIHPLINNVEYLAAGDLSAGLPQRETAEEQARQFLFEYADLYGLTREDLEACLYLCETLTSRLGTHCIFRLWVEQLEVAEASFVAHIDRQGRLMMVTSTYDPHRTLDPGEHLEDRLKDLLPKVANLGGTEHASSVEITPMWFESWPESGQSSNKTYLLGLQVKMSTRIRVGGALQPRDKVEIIVEVEPGKSSQYPGYSVGAYASPKYCTGRGMIYAGFWSDTPGVPQTTQVDLQELVSESRLAGRYVVIRDEIDNSEFDRFHRTEGAAERLLDAEALKSVQPRPIWPARDFTYSTDLESTKFDRVMAYYHVDLIRRHFEKMFDSKVLEGYDYLAPLQVILDESGLPSYMSHEQCIHLPRLTHTRKLKCTEARNPLSVYHEYTHAITDALARLHRQDNDNPGKPRFHEGLQAAVMDEGLADYFACSLAMRQGAKRAVFGVLKLRERQLSLDVRRELEDTTSGAAKVPNLLAVASQVASASSTGTHALTHQWGLEWGRFLWFLRIELGVEIADTIIAHSILFLTRYSTFGAGVLALYLADRLLYGSAHSELILAAGAGATNWREIAAEPQAENLT